MQVSGELNLAVIVAVVAVGMVQMPVHQVIDVVAVRHRFVAAVRAMLVGLVVLAAGVLGCARGRVGAADRQLVLLDAPLAHVVQVAVVQVVNMVAVLYGRVTAIESVLVRVSLVMMGSHDPFSLEFAGTRQRVVPQIDDVPIRQSEKTRAALRRPCDRLQFSCR
jgi:hypothetical protein